MKSDLNFMLAINPLSRLGTGYEQKLRHKALTQAELLS